MKWAALDAADSLGLGQIPTATPGNRILVFHGVVPEANININARFVSTRCFEELILELKKTVRFVSVEEAMQQNVSNKLRVALTFDDGYANNYFHAMPILRRHGIPATFFVCTSRPSGWEPLWTDMLDLIWFSGRKQVVVNGIKYQNQKRGFISNEGKALKDESISSGSIDSIAQLKPYWNDLDPSFRSWMKPYWELMDDSMLKELSGDDLFEVGVHGAAHLSLTAQPISDVEKELQDSAGYLTRLCGKPVKTMAYPFGFYSEELLNAVTQLGFERQLLVSEKKQAHLRVNSIAARLGNNPYISTKNQVRAIINGHY